MNDFSDDILVAAGQRGDKRAYALLVKRHYRYVFGVCLGMLGNIHDAEDIAQDAMLRGFLKIKKLRSSEQFGEWILRIAKNLCIDFLRRKRQVRALAARQAAERRQTTNAGIDLEEAIGRLPREYRLPLVMYYFDNKSTKTIGEKLNISYSGVCKRIRTARKELHRLLTEEVHNGQ
ncbi:MAG: RNA polymerase sigma factor [Planctomycetota bacterium]